MNDGATVWLPYRREQIPGLPEGLSYRYWDGAGPVPGDPGEVTFLVGPPVPGAERVLRRVLPHMGRLRVLQLLSSGYDHMVPLLGAMPAGTRLATARGGVHREATAELAVTLLLTLSRGIDRFITRQAEARWRPEVRSTLYGKRVLVVGHGAVGSAVAARLGAFGCEVVRWPAPGAPPRRAMCTGPRSCAGCCPRRTPWCCARRSRTSRAACSVRTRWPC